LSITATPDGRHIAGMAPGIRHGCSTRNRRQRHLGRRGEKRVRLRCRGQRERNLTPVTGW
ncbi:MAG: hypothetical protein ACRD08_06795, partial [Acidimicrobiales bacterium]